MVKAIEVASGVNGLSTNFSVERLSFVVLVVKSQINGGGMPMDIDDIEDRRHRKIVAERRRTLIGRDGPQSRAQCCNGAGINDLDLPEDGNCVDVTEWSMCPWTRMNIEDHRYHSLCLCDVATEVADATA